MERMVGCEPIGLMHAHVTEVDGFCLSTCAVRPYCTNSGVQMLYSGRMLDKIGGRQVIMGLS